MRIGKGILSDQAEHWFPDKTPFPHECNKHISLLAVGGVLAKIISSALLSRLTGKCERTAVKTANCLSGVIESMKNDKPIK